MRRAQPGPSARRGLCRRPERDPLDPELRFLQLALAMLLERGAALVGLNRGLEIELAALEVLNDPLELGERLLEAHAGDFRRRLSSSRRRPRARPRTARKVFQLGGSSLTVRLMVGIESELAQRVEMGKAALASASRS